MTNRKDFLAASALAAVAPLTARAATEAPSAAAPAANADPAKLAFDLPAFNAMLQRPAKHKHAFSAVHIAGADVLGSMRNTIKAYNDIGTPSSDIFPVAVLYHGYAIALAFNDAIWNEILLPFARNPKFAGQPAAKDLNTVINAQTQGNPQMIRQGGARDTSIPSLISDTGAQFLVCNNALHGVSNYLAVATKTEAADMYRRLASNLVPGSTLVPAGVWAIHAVQERGFTLLETSV